MHLKTHLFLYTIHYFSSFPYNPSDRQLPQSFAGHIWQRFQLVLQDEKYKKILGICREQTEGIPYCRARTQHSASPGQALQGHAHTLLRGQKPGCTHYQSKIPKAWEGNPNLRPNTYSENRGNHMESVSYRVAWCFWFVSGNSNRRGNAYRTCTTGQTRAPPDCPSFEVLAHSPAAAEGCTHQFASFRLGERGVTRESSTCEL